PYIMGDLSVSSSASARSVVAGTSLTYTIVYTNAGPSEAWGTTVTDTLPVSATFGGMLGSGPNPRRSGSTVVWGVGNLAPGTALPAGSLSFTVTVDPAAEGATLTNTVNIEPAGGSNGTRDPHQANNTSTLHTSVTGSA